MKFIVDVNVSYLVDLMLRSKSLHDFIFIRDLDASMKDDEIIHLAEQEKGVIITSDKDFGELVFRKQLKHQGVLLLRIEELELTEKLKVVEQIIDEHYESLRGNFAVYQKGKLRIR